jgi:hypothetical protein
LLLMSNGSISGVLVVAAFNSVPREIHVGPDLRRRGRGSQVSHAHQIVGRASEGKDPVHFAHSTMPNLPHQGDRLQPAEAFFDPLPFSLTEGITRVTRGAAINRAASASSI